ncbi:hypothetical protein EI42_01863 [Thermosporothrix hazakensis]|jgi:hypothetical protein|uniref:Uncharacterized protein n=1 Tax=Thermosporothrix hazakensis TaxID=644383 RepID=A0A326U9K7_THEHA|nr:hypothetical protein EI42_01863 [Thermosporothrix hazakensis]
MTLVMHGNTPGLLVPGVPFLLFMNVHLLLRRSDKEGVRASFRENSPALAFYVKGLRIETYKEQIDRLYVRGTCGLWSRFNEKILTVEKVYGITFSMKQ